MEKKYLKTLRLSTLAKQLSWMVFSLLAFSFSNAFGDVDPDLHQTPDQTVEATFHNSILGDAISENPDRLYSGDFTGSLRFNIGLVRLNPAKDLSFNLGIRYDNSQIVNENTGYGRMFPASAVGIGFKLDPPYIVANKRTTPAVEDDSYFLNYPELGSGELIKSSSDRFYLKTDPSIVAQHTVISSPFSDSWIITLQNGTQYKFGGDDNHCLIDNSLGQRMGQDYVMCNDPATFTKSALKWYLSSIENANHTHSISFTYKVDRKSRYYQSITVTSKGAASTSNIIEKVDFSTSEIPNTNGQSVYCPSEESDPEFECKRLQIDAIEDSKNGFLDYKYLFSFDKSATWANRLLEIRKQCPYKTGGNAGSIEKSYKKFEYCPLSDASKFDDGFLKSVKDESGAIEEFQYTDIAIPTTSGRQFFDLKSANINGTNTNLLALPGNSIANPRVFFSREINGRYYLGIEDTWADPLKKHLLDRNPRKVLIEFRSMGTFYKISRVFKPIPDQSSVSFHMAPAGDYFVWSTSAKAEVWDLRKHIPENRVILPNADYSRDAEFNYQTDIYKETEVVKGYDQKRNSPPYGSGSVSFTQNVPGYSVHMFADWFVVASNNVDYSGIIQRGFYLSFFGKNSAGAWQILNLPVFDYPTAYGRWEQITHSGQGDGLLIPNNGVLQFQKVNDEPTQNTFWSNLNTQAGNNFLAVLRNSQPSSENMGQLNSILRTFTKNGTNIEVGNYFNDMSAQCNSTNTAEGAGIDQYLSLSPFNDRNEKLSFSSISSFSVWGNLLGFMIEYHFDDCCPSLPDFMATTAVYKFQNKKKWFHSYNPGNDNNDRFGNDGEAKKVLMGKGFYLYGNGRLTAGPYLSWVTFNVKNGDLIKRGHDFPSESHPGGISLPDWSDGGNLAMSEGDDYIVLDMVTSRNDLDQLGKIHMFPDPNIKVLSRYLSKQTFDPVSMGAGIRIGEGKVVGLTANVIAYKKFGRFDPGQDAVTLPMPEGWSKAAAFPISDRLVLTDGNNVAFYQNHDREYISGTETARVLQSRTILSKGSDSKVEDGTKWVQTLSYDNAAKFFNSGTNTLNFSEVTIITPEKKIRRKYFVNDYINAPNGPNSFTEKDLLKHGLVASQEETKNQFESGADRSKKTFTYSVKEFSNSPKNEALFEPIYSVRTLKSESKKDFWTKEKTTNTRFTFYDDFNGAPKISITKTGGQYRLNLTRYKHEFETNPVRYDKVAQTAQFIFSSDPCADASDPDPADECSNVYSGNLAFLKTDASKKRASESEIFAYNSYNLLKSTYEWQPAALGVDALPTLDASATDASWHKVTEIMSRSLDNAWAMAKSETATSSATKEVGEVNYFGGPNGLLVGKAVNASSENLAILTGEEESINPDPVNQPPRFGAFGEWETAGASIANEIKHSGKNSFKISGAYGPSINLKVHDDAKGIFYRHKGMVMSAWVFMTGTNNNGANDPIPVFAMEFRDASGNYLDGIDAIGVREANQLLPYNKWVKVDYQIPFDVINQKIGSNNGYLRFWIGKAALPCTAPCTPLPVTNQVMYVDDVRIYPSDAVVKTFNYDEKNRLSATLDENNDPKAYSYNIWGGLIGSKDEKNMARMSTASRKFGED